MKSSKGFGYEGKYTKEISFPLGGIGSGCIGLGGNGRLIDFEIFNRPNKSSYNGCTHIAVKAEGEEGVLDARVLNGDLQPSFMGDLPGDHFGGFGFGMSRSTMAGVPHFEEAVFSASFPFAALAFKDSRFPGPVELTAFNPFIPLNDKDSSLPAAFFEVEFFNDTAQELTYTAAFSLENPAKSKNVNLAGSEDGIRFISLETTDNEKSDPAYGNMCVATCCPDASTQNYWYRGQWFDSLGVYWQDFSKPGNMPARDYKASAEHQDTATLSGTVTVAPNNKGSVKFIVSWYYPNCVNYWNAEKCSCEEDCTPETWLNYYASLFGSAKDCALYSFENYTRLYEQSRMFSDALYSSTLPESVLDAVTANIAVLKTPTCLRLSDGSFYAFEGCHCHEGCCEGSCTHVWNYAYALPFLFPALERSMRELDYKYNMNAFGGMTFRLQLPLGRDRGNFRPCADGQFGGIIKVYREWKISGDNEWLKVMWPGVKKNLEYAWSVHNDDKWDPEKTGVLHGRQHHTLDMELFGPNSWLTGFYLAALKAAAEMGRYLGDEQTVSEYMALFNKGKAWIEENCFNGEFFYQKIDLKDKNLLEPYEDALHYWNAESKEIKYQIGEGSAVDQVLAQWHANICGLGEIFDKAKVKKALATIYKHNFKRDMRNHFNPCRLYCLNDERGTIICDWPDKTKKPVIPVPYAEETMHGFEYQAAIHMLQEGMAEQGVELIKAVRDRYDGYRRNPWNEMECGSNYARSMASYAALPTYAGFEFDMPNKTIGFNPIVKGDFKCFWSLGSGWGVFERSGHTVTIKILYGTLHLARLNLPFMKPNNITVNGLQVAYTVENGGIVFEKPMLLKEVCLTIDSMQ
ncbi:MAG: hypothetical protein GXZ02_10290 [Clostridiales bacterium]|nr:hypothetical protein [Clostridiales bacterium]